MIRYTLTVEGMMCPMCEAHVNEAVRNELAAQGVKAKKVVSSHKRGTTEILIEAVPDIAAVTAAIEKTGYNVCKSESAEEKKKGFFSFGR